MKWRTIQSAPKDGTRILVTSENREPVIAFWDDRGGREDLIPFWNKGTDYSIVDSRNHPPTHWQPIPAAPKQSHA